MNISLGEVDILGLVGLIIFFLGIILILAGLKIINIKIDKLSIEPSKKTLIAGIILLVLGIGAIFVQVLNNSGLPKQISADFSSTPEIIFSQTPTITDTMSPLNSITTSEPITPTPSLSTPHITIESSSAPTSEPTRVYQQPLCGKDAYVAHIYSDQTADVYYEFPSGYTIGYISSDPSFVESSNGQSHLFRVPFTLLVKGVSSISLKGVSTRLENDERMVNTYGCLYYPQDTEQAELKAREDFSSKLKGNGTPELYLVTNDSYGLLSSKLICLTSPYLFLGNDWISSATYINVTTSNVKIFSHCPPATSITYDSIAVDDELQKVELVCSDGTSDITNLFKSYIVEGEQLLHWSSTEIVLHQNCRIDFSVKDIKGGKIGIQIIQSR